MAVQLFNPAGIAEVPGVSLVAVGTGSRLIAIAGQTGRDLEGNFADGLAAQFTKALSNLGVALASADASQSDLLKMTVYIVGWREELADEMWQGAVAFAEQGGVIDPPAAWTLVGVQALADPRCLIEIEALAILD